LAAGRGFRIGYFGRRHLPLKGQKRERWEELCKQAADEQDPEKLIDLIQEINQLLDEKEQRLKQQKGTNQAGS
jgi:predicted Zn-dependent protease